MSSPLQYEDYTVVWIAVLPIEADVAVRLLDRRHDGGFESGPEDDYLYIAGEVNGHNVAIATLPAGQNYGIGSAAALANHIKARFVNIWFALLVGVAAGLPNLSQDDPSKYRDIRLGDVLVSEPNESNTGVVQYDLGRFTNDGFEASGRLAEPPSILRSAISRMKLLYDRPYKCGNVLATYLESLQKADGGHKFLYPNPATDRLFEASIPGGGASNIDRAPRDEQERTLIWYGNIGSGNSLMRNAVQRDQLRDRHNLIGFEMEAAGIMNILPTGVIRGVCDYGDGYKNKEWQPFAAAAAAVYAKGILYSIHPKRVSGERRLRDLQDGVQQGENLDETDQDVEVLASLAFPQMRDRRLNVHKAHEGTCRWILSLPKYVEWESCPQGLLWIKGKPGAGKSTVMSFLYTIIGEKVIMPNTTYLEFFFNARGHSFQYTFLGMLRSLLNQIYYQDPRCRDNLKQIYLRNQMTFGKGTRVWEWQQEELSSLLEEAIIKSASYRQVFMFVDALDEAGESTALKIADYFHRINAQIAAASGCAKFYLSCRHYPITEISQTTEISVENHNHDDIRAYIEAGIGSASPTTFGPFEQQQWREVGAHILQQANGVFQWVSLVLPVVARAIRNGHSPASTIRRLKTVPQELSNAYEHILLNVLDRHSIQLSYRVFQWACLAERSLSLSELRFALAAYDSIPSSTNLPSILSCETDDFISSDSAMKIQLRALSAGLLEDVQDNIQVTHQSVRDFMMKDGLALLESLTSQAAVEGARPVNVPTSPVELLEKCHAQLSRACLRYLATEQVDIPMEISENPRAELLLLTKSSPFIEYAAQYLFLHAKKAGNRHDELFAEQTSLINRILWLWTRMNCELLTSAKFYRLFDHLNILHAAAAFGLQDLMHHVLKTGFDVNSRDNRQNFTPLHFAAWLNEVSTAHILLAADAQLDAVDTEGRTPLMLAASWGHEDVVQLLISHGAGVDIREDSGRTALIFASLEGCTSIAQHLLERDAQIDMQQDSGETALIWASKANHKATMRVLLSHKADMDIGDSSGDTALTWVARQGDLEAMKLLIEQGANIDLQNQGGETALMRASYGTPNIPIIKLLLAHHANPNLPDITGLTPLMRATKFQTDTTLLALLLKNSADTDAQDDDGMTALMYATSGARQASVECLLAHGAGVDVQDNLGNTALMWAVRTGKQDAVSILLRSGADVNIQNSHGTTALMASVRGKKIAMTLDLLKHHADVNLRDLFGETALAYAAVSNDVSLVTILLEHGADINIQDTKGDIALYIAVSSVHERVVKLLLDSGADIHVQNDEARQR